MITLQYGDNTILWSDIVELPEVKGLELRCLTADNVVVVLRVFETQAAARLARESLIQQVSEAVDGGVTIVIIIDDL